MAQNENSHRPDAGDSDSQAVTVIRKLEEDLDFKPYLEAVNAGSSRTRSTVYVLVAMVVIIFTGYRNTTAPDWLDQRLAKFQMASACVRTDNPIECNADSPSLTPDCKAAVDYSKEFLFSQKHDPLLTKREFCRELGDQINALIRARTESLSLRLPFFGVVLDSNDLGLISGIFLLFILLVLDVGIDREILNLDRAIKRAKAAKSPERQREGLELLLMTQVLAERPGPTYGVHILLFFVVVVYGFVTWSDLSTYAIAVQLEGRAMAILETAADAIVFLIVLLLCGLVWRKQHKLDRKLDTLDRDLKQL